MIKVPATAAGVPAIEQLTADGVNVNVTLLFSVARYERVIEAYLTGLERRMSAGQPLDGITSVASFFVSRVDTRASQVLDDTSPLRNRVAVANAHRAYQSATAPASPTSAGRRSKRLGARPQRPL
jgi:transaldolase